MPSSLFHAALAALIGIAILEEDFDKWALLLILTAALLPDVDSFLAMFWPGAHRVYLHNIFIVLVPALILAAVTHLRGTDLIEKHWGHAGERVLWTAIIVVAVAGIAPDLFRSGVNLFWPVHDQFYHFTGNVIFSTQHGIIQTLFNVSDAAIGSTYDLYYGTGIEQASEANHAATATEGGVDRRLPLFGSGMQLLISIVSFAVVGYQMHRHKNG